MPLTTKEILERKAWPRAKEVFGYINRKTQKTTNEKLMGLRAAYSEANCLNIARFVDIIQFDEAVYRYAVSYNFSLVPCLPKNFRGDQEQIIKAELLQHDLLVGSRYEAECASSWLDTIIKSGQSLDTDELQVIDKIFGSALQSASKPSVVIKKSELVEIANSFRWMLDYPTQKLN